MLKTVSRLIQIYPNPPCIQGRVSSTAVGRAHFQQHRRRPSQTPHDVMKIFNHNLVNLGKLPLTNSHHSNHPTGSQELPFSAASHAAHRTFAPWTLRMRPCPHAKPASSPHLQALAASESD
mmetsp:Transcript_141954/g.258023  ORF Transcript_141954/g.258023 Transcript_141954/m.258023 type:complete len:121 (+) Transcript_141954:81-443(+)